MSKGSKPAFQALRRGLRLMVEDLDSKEPSDAAYVYSGYAPLSIRLVEAAARTPAWSSVPDDLLKSIPGPHFSRTPSADARAPAGERSVLHNCLMGLGICVKV